MNKNEIAALLDGRDNSERSMINLQDLVDSSRDNMVGIIDYLDLEIGLIEIEARHYCDKWWAAFEKNVQSKSPDKSYLGTRVRRIGESIVMEWHTRTPTKDKNKYFAKYIRKGTSIRYSDKIFKKEPVWAQELGKEIEDRYAILRSKAKRIGSMRKTILAYAKMDIGL